MLNTIKKRSNDRLTIALVGRVDASNASDLEQEVKSSLDGVTELVFDLEKLVYISSAGLRVLLMAQKKMDKQGSMKVLHVNDMVMEVFVNMGFKDILTIE
jgi:anti-sigma B factor antagonist